MKASSPKCIFVIIFSLNLILLINFNMNVRGTVNLQASIVSDTYIQEGSSADYSGTTSVNIGVDSSLRQYEGYFKFDITTLLDYIIPQVGISFYIDAINTPMTINLILITAEWDAHNIQWSNKPAHGQIIGSKEINNENNVNKYLSFDISEIYQNYLNSQLTEISFCINHTGALNPSEKVEIDSKEGNNEPTIYIGESLVVLVLIFLIIVIGILSLTYTAIVYYKRKKKKNISLLKKNGVRKDTFDQEKAV